MGPTEGNGFPTSALPDQHGCQRLICTDTRGPQGALVVFHRSADW